MKACILYVEDNLENGEMMVERLRKLDVLVLVATTGSEGLELAMRHRPDLILMDYMLPGMDGAEVARRLKTHPELGKTPIVMLTAIDNADARRRAFEMGCNYYLVKPVVTSHLSHVLTTYLGEDFKLATNRLKTGSYYQN